MTRARRAGAALILGALLLGASSGARGQTAARDHGIEAAHIGSVAVLPFVSRGSDPESWPRLRGALRPALAGHRITLVPEEAVEAELRRMRLRDTSILLHEEMADLARAVGADRLLTGFVYRVSPEQMAVTFSARLIDPVARRIDAMVFTAQEGEALEGVLGSGDPVTLDRTLAAAAGSFVDDLLAQVRGEGAGRPDILKRSILAPHPNDWFSDRLESARIERILVLPFRSRVPHPGAGQAAADLVSLGMVHEGHLTVVEAGDATRKLLEQGWRTGVPVGTDPILSLRLDPGVEAVLMGSVDTWVEARPQSAAPPEVALSARLLDTRTGEILWAASQERKGDETLVIYEFGNVHLTEELLARASYEMIAPLLHKMEKAARKGAEGERP